MKNKTLWSHDRGPWWVVIVFTPRYPGIGLLISSSMGNLIAFNLSLLVLHIEAIYNRKELP